jgi:hypothetical protein
MKLWGFFRERTKHQTNSVHCDWMKYQLFFLYMHSELHKPFHELKLCARYFFVASKKRPSTFITGRSIKRLSRYERSQDHNNTRNWNNWKRNTFQCFSKIIRHEFNQWEHNRWCLTYRLVPQKFRMDKLSHHLSYTWKSAWMLQYWQGNKSISLPKFSSLKEKNKNINFFHLSLSHLQESKLICFHLNLKK